MRTHCGSAQVKWQSKDLRRSHKTQRERSTWELPPSFYWSTSCTTLGCQSVQQTWLQQWILSNHTAWVSGTDYIHHAIQAILFQTTSFWNQFRAWSLPQGTPRSPEVIVDINDVIISGRSQQEHDERLRSVLERMQEAGFTLNEKGVFSVGTLRFLGHIISQEGIKVDPAKVEGYLRPSGNTRGPCFRQRSTIQLQSICKFLRKLRFHPSYQQFSASPGKRWSWACRADGDPRSLFWTTVPRHFNMGPQDTALTSYCSGGGPRQPGSSGLAPVSKFHSSVPLFPLVPVPNRPSRLRGR